MRNIANLFAPPTFARISFIVSFVLLALEIVLFQGLQFVSSYMQAHLGIALTLLGIGGGCAYAILQHDRHYLVRVMTRLFPIAVAVSFFGLVLFPSHNIVGALLLTVPFFVGGYLIAYAYTRLSPPQAYLYDLAGGGLGVLLAIVSIPIVREEGTLILATAVSFFTPMFLAAPSERWRRYPYQGILVALTILTIHIAWDPWNLAHITPCGSDTAKVFCNTPPVIYSYGSLVERIDVREKADLLVVAFNGLPNDNISPFKAGWYRWDPRVPSIIHDPKILVIGTAAQGVTKTARVQSQSFPVTGVEINPAIVKLMTANETVKQYGRDPYAKINIFIEDGRSFLSRTNEQYDVITVMNTHRVRNIGTTGGPEFLHTKEAVTSYLEHLTERGMVVFEERNANDRAHGAILRFISTAYSALRDFGVDDPSQHFVVYNWYGYQFTGESYSKSRGNLYTQIIVTKSPLIEGRLSELLAWGRILESSGGDPLMWQHLPGQAIDSDFARLIVSGGVSRPVRFTDLSPVTDDRPFPYDIFPQRSELNRLFTITAVLSATLLLILFVTMRRRINKATAPSLTFLCYFGMVGIGYLIVETVLLQWFQRFIGLPTLTLAIVVGGLLISSGLSGYFLRLNPRNLRVALVVLGVSLVVFTSLFGGLLEMVATLPLSLRTIVALLCIVPLGVLMGIPFPNGLRLLLPSQGRAAATAAAYGLNSIAAALAVPGSLYLAMEVGIRATVVVGALFFFIAFVLARTILLTRLQQPIMKGVSE